MSKKKYVFEIFKVCSNHNSNYSISNFGSIIRVKSTQGSGAGRKLSPYINKYGYLRVDFYQDGIRKSHSIHRLVMHYFVGPCPKDREVNHKDGNKQNPYVGNLEYVTSKENIRHAIKLKLRKNYGENHPRSILTKKIVKNIRKDYRDGFTRREIRRKYSLKKEHVYKIVSYKIWKSVS